MLELETPRRVLRSSAERFHFVRPGLIRLSVGIVFAATPALAQVREKPELPSFSMRKGLFNCTDDRGVKFTVDVDVAQRRVKIKRPAIEKEFVDGKVEESTVLLTIPLTHRYQVSMEGSKIRFRERLLRNDAILISERPAGYLDLDTGQFSVSGLGPVVRTDRPQYVITASCIESKYAHVVASASEAPPPTLSPASFVSALRVALSREVGDVKPYGKDIEVLSELATRCSALASSDRTCRVDRVGTGAPQGGFIPKPVVSNAESRKLYAYAGPPTKAVGAGGFRIAVFIDPRDPSRLDKKCTQGGPWNDILSLCMEPLFDAVIGPAQENAVPKAQVANQSETVVTAEAAPTTVKNSRSEASDPDMIFSCADRSPDGTPIDTTIFVYSASRHVKIQEPRATIDYRDGAVGNIITKSTLLLAALVQNASQHVVIDDKEIRFSATFVGTKQTAFNTLNLRNGLWIIDDEAPRRCTRLPQ